MCRTGVAVQQDQRMTRTESSATEAVEFRSSRQRIANAFGILLIPGLSGYAFTQTSSALVGVAASIIAGIVLVLRCLRLGVVVGDRDVVVRNVFSTRRVPIEQCERFEVRTVWLGESTLDLVTLVRSSGRRITVSGLGLPRSQAARAPHLARMDRMNALLRRRKRSLRKRHP